jgi:hypothetical protein
MRRVATLLCCAVAYAEETACSAHAHLGNTEVGSQVLVDGDVEQMQTHLLQSQTTHVRALLAKRDAPADRPLDEIVSVLRSPEGVAMSATERAEMIKPVAWFHIQKTGTSFANTLYHTPAICPNMPADSYVSSAFDTGTWDHEAWGREKEMCPGGFSKSYQSTLSYWLHEGMSRDAWALNRGHLVTMLRQPEQRILSDYYNKVFQPMRYPCPDSECPHVDFQTVWPYSSSTPSAREYAEVMGGCVVRQFTLDDYDPCYRVEVPTPDDVNLAINKMRQGFAFVGITDHWDLSVCLFRAMFGGECNSLDLINTKPFNGTTADSETYDESLLEGWTDKLDGPVYKAGVALFKKSLSLYSVDETACASMCGQLA